MGEVQRCVSGKVGKWYGRDVVGGEVRYCEGVGVWL